MDRTALLVTAGQRLNTTVVDLTGGTKCERRPSAGHQHDHRHHRRNPQARLNVHDLNGSPLSLIVNQ